MPELEPETPWRNDPAVPPLVRQVVARPDWAPKPDATVYVWLHGAGATEEDLLGLAGQIDPDAIHVAYRAPIPYGQGFCWFPLGWDGASIQIDDSVAPHSRDRIACQLRHDLASLGISGATVTAIGFSQGAAMALATAASDPGLIHRQVLLSGLRVPSVLDQVAAQTRLPPTLVQHGTLDDIVPIAEGRALAGWCATRNPDGTTFEEYEMHHTIGQESLASLVQWLQSTSPVTG
ncbi:MAG: alpha/beta hydrolase [Armatimonadaceae bacterium]